jgi:hypothetical protein
MPNRWIATMVKENGKWVMASYHVSMNVLDNPLLNGVKKAGIFGAAIAAIVGVLIGRVIGKRRAN